VREVGDPSAQQHQRRHKGLTHEHINH
jgi:hypothetical protein